MIGYHIPKNVSVFAKSITFPESLLSTTDTIVPFDPLCQDLVEQTTQDWTHCNRSIVPGLCAFWRLWDQNGDSMLKASGAVPVSNHTLKRQASDSALSLHTSLRTLLSGLATPSFILLRCCATSTVDIGSTISYSGSRGGGSPVRGRQCFEQRFPEGNLLP